MGVIIVLVAAGFVFNAFFPLNARAGALGKPVAAPRSYVGKVEQMKTIQPVVENGKITFKLADVDKLNMVNFELKNNEGFLVPVMAYITSSGRLFAGSSLCECGSRKFFLAGEALVCSSCRTTYTIEDQKFISGAAIAGKYPPTSMKPVVENGTILIEQSEILNWRIRAK